MNRKTVIICACALLVSFLLGALAAYFPVKAHFKAVSETFSPKVDTLLIRDTLRLSEPKEIEKPVYLRDTLYIPVLDSVLVERTDTLFLPIPREQRQYGDSTYRAWVSGVSPKLDSILIFPETKVITKTFPVKVKRKVNVGLQGGVGAVQPFGQKFEPKLGYYVGIGLEYNF